ncbi:MAG: 50S ribosomal protein L33 [Vampirovibrionales bacterium]|jgi:large subunit ribosomal protein L33|nr:50S ribosomal protein L33 [Vampirovibrionales bacterium]
MAKKGKGGQFIKMKSAKSGHEYYTTKNKQNNPERMELRKYDPIAREHAVYKEAK